MTFLEIVKEAVLRSGLHDVGPASVVGQTDSLYLRFIGWVKEEWESVQNMNSNWVWMEAVAEFAFSAGSVTGASKGLSVRKWIVDGASVSDGETSSFLAPVVYEDFRRAYRVGSVTESRPQHITERGDTLYFGPAPDKEYTATVRYCKQNQTLSADSDIPEMPSEFHRTLVAGALRRYAAFDDAPEIFTMATAEWRKGIDELSVSQLPPIRFSSSRRLP